MKVLYAIQGTGNGHVARAREVIPHLKELCDLDVAVSGHQRQVDLPHPIAHQVEGLTFTFGKDGGIDYRDSFKQASITRLISEIRNFPTDEYDLVLNDFEPVTAWASKRNGTPSISLSHQCSFASEETPRPAERSRIPEQLMRKFAPCEENVGFHFERYDSFIHTPIIRSEVRGLIPTNAGHNTVYLPAYDDQTLAQLFNQIPQSKWQIFSKHARSEYEQENVLVRPVNSQAFLESLASCAGLLTGAGFEAPAEALFLGKKLMVVPMRGQYEQHCNAAALQRLGIPVISQVDSETLDHITEWNKNGSAIQIDYPDETRTVLERIISRS